MKKVLLLCSSHNDLGIIRALRKVGLFIICTGNIENLPGQKWVDEWVCADYSDKEKILNIASTYKVDYVCPCCNDYGVYTAAYIAEKLGLPGYDSYRNTLMLHNKDKFKELAKVLGLLTPISLSFSKEDDAILYIKNATLPQIVKPVDCSAGNGVSLINSDRDPICKILSNAFLKSKEKRIVVEQFIKGTQHGVCTYILNKKVVAICTNNEYSILNPYRVEIDTFPSTLPSNCVNELIEQIEKIADYLDLKDGIFHLQCIFDGERAWIIEVMRRTLGNMYHVLANQLNGFDWEYWEVIARCGMSCNLFPLLNYQQGYFAYKTVLAPKNGIITDISVPENYKKYVFSDFWLMALGDKVCNYMSQPIGFLFFMFHSQEHMKNVLIDNYVDDIVSISCV